MSFRDLIETSQALALADKLVPSELSVWERYCREFSINFNTPLLQVRELDPLFVMTQVNAQNLSEFDPEERLEDLLDMVGSLGDRDYDFKKERAIRDEMRKIEEAEALRIKEGRAIHSSLEKDKRVIGKDQSKPKEIPKSGGLNMDAIRRLNNQDSEG